jgi:hypothetical protein
MSGRNGDHCQELLVILGLLSRLLQESPYRYDTPQIRLRDSTWACRRVTARIGRPRVSVAKFRSIAAFALPLMAQRAELFEGRRVSRCFGAYSAGQVTVGQQTPIEGGAPRSTCSAWRRMLVVRLSMAH